MLSLEHILFVEYLNLLIFSGKSDSEIVDIYNETSVRVSLLFMSRFVSFWSCSF